MDLINLILKKTDEKTLNLNKEMIKFINVLFIYWFRLTKNLAPYWRELMIASLNTNSFQPNYSTKASPVFLQHIFSISGSFTSAVSKNKFLLNSKIMELYFIVSTYFLLSSITNSQKSANNGGKIVCPYIFKPKTDDENKVMRSKRSFSRAN